MVFIHLKSFRTSKLPIVNSLEGGVKSQEAQMMVVITKPDENLILPLKSHSNAIHVFNKVNISTCIQVKLNFLQWCIFI